MTEHKIQINRTITVPAQNKQKAIKKAHAHLHDNPIRSEELEVVNND